MTDGRSVGDGEDGFAQSDIVIVTQPAKTGGESGSGGADTDGAGSGGILDDQEAGGG